MSGSANPGGKQVVVVVGATSKWQADGRNTRLVHGDVPVAEDAVPLSARWGVGGAVAQKFAAEGCFVVMTTRNRDNAAGLLAAVTGQGGAGMVVELDLADPPGIKAAFAEIREAAGDPEVLVYNAGYLEGRQLPPEQELMEFFPAEMFEVAIDVSCRGPFLVAQEVLPAMRRAGRGTLLFSNNPQSLRGRKRYTGMSLSLSAGDGARSRPGADRGIYRARGACRHSGNRRGDRFAGHSRGLSGAGDGPGADCRSLLLSSPAGPLGLDP